MKIGQEIKLAQRPFFKARIVGVQLFLFKGNEQYRLEWLFPNGRKVRARKGYRAEALTPLKQAEQQI